MKQWDEYKFSQLQYKISHCRCFGRKIELDGGAITLMAAYLIGVNDGAREYTSEYIEKILDGLEMYVE